MVPVDHDPLQLEELSETTVLDGAFVTRVSAQTCGRWAKQFMGISSFHD